jgi:membrane protein
LRARYRLLMHRLKLLYWISKPVKTFWDRISYYTKGLWFNFDDHHIFIFAGGLAFSLFICIIPFVLILFWLLGILLDSASVQIQINTLIDTVIPYEMYSDYIKEILTKRIAEVIQYKNVAGFFGLVGLMFAASGFSSSIRTILNTVFGRRVDINFFLGKLRDFALIIMTVLVFLVSTVLLPLIEVLRKFSEYVVELKFLQYPIFQTFFTTAFSFIIVTAIFGVLYRYVPVVKIRRRAVFVGAVWAGVLWEGAKHIFGYYLYHFATYGKVYGAYALVIVVAFWIYYSSMVFIIGAEMGKLYHDRIEAEIKLKEQNTAS